MLREMPLKIGIGVAVIEDFGDWNGI